jgi:ParB/RepB/Spo0J family partition protein
MPVKTPTATDVPLALTEANPSKQTHVDLKELRAPHWANPREPVKPEQVKGLAATMERFGCLQPIVVMPAVAPDSEGMYLLAGHRRVAAAKLLGWKTLPAHVLVRPKGSIETPEHLGRAVALVENGQREDLDPLRDCEVVESLLAEEGASLETVAAELGRPKSWVARRARLTGLGERARKLAKGTGPIAHWPAAWLELLALLPDDAQVVLANDQTQDYNRVESQHDLTVAVRALLKRLGTAPWDLADAALAPTVGACTTCQKHTGAQADLFEAPRKVELKEAQCLDSECFAMKLATWRARALEAARAKHGAELVVLRADQPSVTLNGRGGKDWKGEELANGVEEELEHAARSAKPAKGAPRVLQPHQVAPAKEGDKGAVPVLVETGKDAGKVKWMRLGKPGQNGEVGRAPATRSSAPAAKPKSLKVKREGLMDRRQRHMVEAGRELVQKWCEGELPKELDGLLDLDQSDKLMDLVGAWGCADTHKDDFRADDGDERLELLKAVKKRNGRVLRGLCEMWGKALGTWKLQRAQPHFSELEAILKATGQLALLASLAEDAIAVMPEPKSWAGAEKPKAGGKPATKAKAVKAGKKPAAAKVVKRPKGKKPKSSAAKEVACRVCGCIDSMACEGGCSWSEPNLCSSCAAKAKAPAKRKKPSGKDAASGEREED